MRGCIALAVALASAPAMAGPHAMTIENKTDGVVRGVYASAAGDDNWHLDHLRDNIQAGERAVITLSGGGCVYDVRVLLETRPDELLFMNVDVCKAPVILVEAGRGRPVRRQAE